MRRRERGEKKHRSGEVPTGSFSDIAFLLIIYFLVATVLVMVFAIKFVIPSFTWKGRRMVVSRWKRMTQWEFWPAWLFYTPVFCHYLWLALRHRTPVSLAWSTPGAALLVTTGAVQGGWPAAVGAFVATGVLVVLTGLVPRLGDLVAAIPFDVLLFGAEDTDEVS